MLFSHLPARGGDEGAEEGQMKQNGGERGSVKDRGGGVLMWEWPNTEVESDSFCALHMLPFAGEDSSLWTGR